jgi:hypothetical protein
MDANPPGAITGYRKLSQDDTDLFNEIKAHEQTLGELWQKVRNLAHGAEGLTAQDHQAVGRWASLARTHLETGLMYLGKAVARPTNGLGRLE